MIKDFKEELSSYSFQTVVNTVESIQKDCEDYITTPRKSIFLEQGKMLFSDDAGKERNFEFDSWSFGQYCARLGLPAQYLEKCIDNGRYTLAKQNVDTWRELDNKPMLVRTYKEQARGILTNRYTKLDAPDIVKILGDTINMEQFSMKSGFVSPSRMHLRFIGNERLDIAEEDIYPCIFVDSSDVGRSALHVVFGVYKQVCTNGLMASRGEGILFRQRHIGIDEDEFRVGFAASMARIPDMEESYKNYVIAAKAAAISEKEMIRTLKSCGLGKELDKVTEIMNSNYEANKFGFINAMTQIAQRFSLEKRVLIEEAAGNLLIAA